MEVPTELIEEIRGILEKTIVSLKNVEGFLNKRSEKIKETNNKLDEFENAINQNINTINKKIVPEIKKRFNKKFETISGKTKKLSYLLNSFHEALQTFQNEVKQVSEHEINQLLHDVVRLEEMDFSKPIRISTQSPQFISVSSGGSSVADDIAAMGRQTSKPVIRESKTLKVDDISDEGVIDPTRWTDSEIEGFQVFDENITGWKLRDFEKFKGTREMFAIAWRKLSAHDRKRIRNGAWSDQIIKKITLLGRSRFDDD
ncbi:MAG: hypothetical protein ACTSVY_04335 [Candidatus Helarchaeota archaeon]